MTIQITYFGSAEIADTVSLTTTAKTVIVEGEETRKTFAGAQIINVDGANVTVSLYRRDGVTDNLFWRGQVGSHETVSLDRPFVPLVRDTHAIVAEASHANSIQIYPVVVRQMVNAPS